MFNGDVFRTSYILLFYKLNFYTIIVIVSSCVIFLINRETKTQKIEVQDTFLPIFKFKKEKVNKKIIRNVAEGVYVVPNSKKIQLPEF